MLSIEETTSLRLCNGIQRRDFLRIGGLALGCSLAGGFSPAALANFGKSNKSVICIHLEGGPPQMDTFDMKPDGPVDLRGEFKPIHSSVPGTHVCELLPRLSQLADKYTIIRSVVGNIDAHNFDTTQLGYRGLRMPKPDMATVGGAPAVGSVISHLLGPNDGMPPFAWDCTGGSQAGVQTGYLGPTHGPMGLKSSKSAFRLRVPAERIHERSALLRNLDNLRRDIDATGSMQAMDSFNRQAVDVLMAGKLGEALDVSREDPRVRERYVAGAGRYRSHSEWVSRKSFEWGDFRRRSSPHGVKTSTGRLSGCRSRRSGRISAQ